MKTYFIVETNEIDRTSGRTTIGLEKELEKIGISYTEDWEDENFQTYTPNIIINSIPDDIEISIFRIDTDKVGNQELIGHFNFFHRDAEEDVADFIRNHYREIVMAPNGDLSGIKKFNEF